MRLESSLILSLVLSVCTIFPSPSFGQSSPPKIGVGAKVSTLGIGIEGALAVTQRSNVRVGFNAYNYSRNYGKDGVNYDAGLDLRSLQITYDQYLIGPLHVSPGVLAYNGNRVNASASVPAGRSFTLGGTRYYSGQTNPINGTATLSLGKAAPMILLGVGNLVPRSGRHFGINFDAGGVFEGSPATKLNFTGTACVISPTAGCLNAGTDPTVQSNVQSEQNKLNNDLKPFKYYPVLSLGASWKW